MAAIDLNSDLGESFGVWKLGDDEAMLEVVTSANVACGFHAGDPSTLRAVCTAAVANGVSIGAQVAYPDLVGFGRRALDIDPFELRDVVLYQLGALDAFAQVAGGEVAYVKPHGALYHATVHDPAQADAVVSAAAEYDPSLAVLGAPESYLLRAAEKAGLEPVAEAFADRAYLRDGRLVPRSEPDALVVDPAEVATRAVRLATEHVVMSVDGTVDRGRGALAVRARRHAGSGRAGPRRARRARGCRRRDPPVHDVSGAPPRLLAVRADGLARRARRHGTSSPSPAPSPSCEVVAEVVPGRPHRAGAADAGCRSGAGRRDVARPG